MSEETLDHKEALKLVEQAQSKNVFDITKFAKGQAVPQDTVTAYLDIEAAYELSKLNDGMSVITGEAYDEAEKRAKELSERIIASKVIFHMRGVNQDTIEKVTKETNELFPSVPSVTANEDDSAAWMRHWTAALVAQNLIKVVNAVGEEDERLFTTEDVLEMRGHFPKEVWDLLVQKMQQLSLASAYFQGLTDAGFLPKS